MPAIVEPDYTLAGSGLDVDARMLDALPTMTWCGNPEVGLLYCNRALTDFTGMKLEEHLGTGWISTVHPDDRERASKAFADAAAAGDKLSVEFRKRRHDGEYRYVLAVAAPFPQSPGKPIAYVGSITDVTDQKSAQKEKQQGEILMRLMSQTTREGVWVWDVSANEIVSNSALVEITGPVPTGREEAAAWWEARVHPDDRNSVGAAFVKALSENGGLQLEYRFRDLEGCYRSVDDRLSIIRNDAGTVTHVLGAVRDLTDTRRAMVEQERLVRILEATTDFVVIATPDDRLVYMNGAARELCGIQSKGALDGLSFATFHPPWALAIIQAEGFPGARGDGAWRGETAVALAGGAEVPVSQLILAHDGPGGEVEFFSTIMRDISDRKREQVAQIESANRYDAAIRASGQLLFDWDSITNDVNYGGTPEPLLGYSATEMRGGMDRFRKLVHREDLGAFDEEIQRVLSTRDPLFLEFRMRCKNGREIFVRSKGFFFLDRSGRLTRMIGFLADVTAEQEARQELARAHEHLETRVVERTAELARAYIVIQDRAQQQEAVAQLGQRALAGGGLPALLDEAATLVRSILKVDLCSVHEILEEEDALEVRASAGWPWNILGHRDPNDGGSLPGHAAMVREPLLMVDYRSENRFKLSLLEKTVGAVSGLSVIFAGEQPIGTLTAYALHARNFTKEDQNFMQAVANVLSAAIARQRAEESVRTAREQSETANRAKSDFLSRMSHELRTPLNAILGFTQLLELEPSTANQAESIKHISRAGHHLLSLINEVLDIARIEAGRLAMTPEPVDVVEFLRSSADLIQPFAKRHGVTLEMGGLTHCRALGVLADPQRLKQVLLNLLSNAVKYNRRDGQIFFHCEQTSETRVRIAIRDTGLGISTAQKERLFMPFERLGAEATEIEGTGIGLALSRGIVVALGGELTAESEAGVGSTFYLDLPSAEIPEVEPVLPELSAVAAEPAAETPPIRVRTVLYIEDQDLNLRLVERIFLNHPEYRLFSTAQGRLGLELAREHRPDLILLDLNLPDMHGDEVLAQVRRDPVLRNIPVIMVSADAMGDRIDQLLAQGATNYLTKPYKVAEFLRVIRETLAERE